jgi:hypothetical protein
VDASSETAKYNLAAGSSIFIYIGGEKEQLMSESGKDKVYVKNRKGFVKLALQYGADLVPMVRYDIFVEPHCFDEFFLIYGMCVD